MCWFTAEEVYVTSKNMAKAVLTSLFKKGVGRAGLFACCWLLENLLCRTAERAISVVREQRSPKAIETLRQADYIIRYCKSVKQRYGLQYSDTMKRPKSMEADHRYTTPSINTIAQLEYDIMTA